MANTVFVFNSEKDKDLAYIMWEDHLEPSEGLGTYMQGMITVDMIDEIKTTYNHYYIKIMDDSNLLCYTNTGNLEISYDDFLENGEYLLDEFPIRTCDGAFGFLRGKINEFYQECLNDRKTEDPDFYNGFHRLLQILDDESNKLWNGQSIMCDYKEDGV